MLFPTSGHDLHSWSSHAAEPGRLPPAVVALLVVVAGTLPRSELFELEPTLREGDDSLDHDCVDVAVVVLGPVVEASVVDAEDGSVERGVDDRAYVLLRLEYYHPARLQLAEELAAEGLVGLVVGLQRAHRVADYQKSHRKDVLQALPRDHHVVDDMLLVLVLVPKAALQEGFQQDMPQGLPVASEDGSQKQE